MGSIATGPAFRRTIRRGREASVVSTTRRERDSMGEMEVPAEAYYGAQTARAAGNFQISTLRFSRGFIRALGLIKKAAAQVNMDLGLLSRSWGRRSSGPRRRSARAST